MDIEKLVRERAPHLAEQYDKVIESVRGCAQNARAIYDNSDLTDKAKSRKAREQLRVGLDIARETFSKERAELDRKLAALTTKRQRLRLPDAPSSTMEALVREIRVGNTIQELRSMSPEERSRLLRESARLGDRTILDAATASVDRLGFDYDHQLAPAWESWTQTLNETGGLDRAIEETEALASTVDLAARAIQTRARQVVNDTTRDQYNPSKNAPILKDFEAALADMKTESESAAAREAYKERTGHYPDPPAEKADNDGGEKPAGEAVTIESGGAVIS